MLQLFAGENQPRTKEYIAQVRMHHGEEQIVALKSEAYNIKHAHTGIPRIERLNRQTRDFHGDGRIGLLFEGEFHTLAKEGDGGPS